MSDKKTEVFFDKAVFGGYDTTQVDEFVEEARKLLSSQKKENEVLKQKLTILADKIEEYRAAESAEAKPAVAEAPASVRPESPEALEKTLQLLKDQIREAEATLEALVQEKAALTASMARQYEQCLRVMREDALVEIPSDPAEIAAEPPVSVPEPIAEPETMPESEPVPVSVVETIAAAISEREREPDPVVVPEAVIEPVPEPEPESKPEPEPEPIPSIAETVEAGESVYLNTDSEEMASLSYEEALTMVLKKNGILRTTPAAKQQPETLVKAEPANRAEPAAQKEELQTTKIIPRMQAPSPAPVAEKPQKKKEGRSFFGGIRKSIHNFLEDESDDDANFDKTSELQFGKAYNVKNDQ
ncbi:MAG: hypothetical protein E7452_00660 [Ruminococcaceae bacterium]|nr:hypothetical protein [Oscillospiraceae bacterium]